MKKSSKVNPTHIGKEERKKNKIKPRILPVRQTNRVPERERTKEKEGDYCAFYRWPQILI